jgi:hypothetical protein
MTFPLFFPLHQIKETITNFKSINYNKLEF